VAFDVSAVLYEDPLSRMKAVVKWYLAGFYKKPKVRSPTCKYTMI
jgi:hypothetical protein